MWPISNGSGRVALVAAPRSRPAVRAGCRGSCHVVPAAGAESLSRRVSPARHALRHRSSSVRLALCLGDLNVFAFTDDVRQRPRCRKVRCPLADRRSRELCRSNRVFRQRVAISTSTLWRRGAPISQCVKTKNQTVRVCGFLLKGKRLCRRKSSLRRSLCWPSPSVCWPPRRRPKRSTSSRPFARSPASQPLIDGGRVQGRQGLLVLPRLRGAVQEGHREVCCQGQPAARGHPPGEAGQVPLYRRQAEP